MVRESEKQIQVAVPPLGAVCYLTFQRFHILIFMKITIPTSCGCTKEDMQTLSQKRQWHPTPALLPGKSHGRRSLVGRSPWGREESDTTEQLHFRFSLSCIGEGNGNPLQCSCLENPRDGGAWWAAVYEVTQSWTRLSSSSSRLFPQLLTHC